MKTVYFHPAADRELNEATRYLEARSVGLGHDFLDEVRQAIDQITELPEASPKVGPRTRRKTLWRFPYSLFYAIQPDRIRIVAIAHQKRRPDYWYGRVQRRVLPQGD